MRLAKLFCTDSGWFYINPARIIEVYADGRGKALLRQDGMEELENLDMTIDEAVAEINAAMMGYP